MRYASGDIVKVLTNVTATSTGVVTAMTCRSNGISLYPTIDLHNYPSYNDFLGEPYNCLPGQIATVIKRIGRPLRIREGSQFWEYDVYEILLDGIFLHVFAVNIAHVDGQ